MKIVIIGGGAAGASCAARLRRLDENAQILIIEKTNEISIANCGLPYYVSGVISERENLLVSTPAKFKNWFNIDIKLNTEVTKINRQDKNLELAGGEIITYDKLVLAQGANPVMPNFEEACFDKIFNVRTLKDADRIKDFISKNNPQNAVIIGGGFIGIEMAENLVHAGLTTTLVEAGSRILTQVDEEIAQDAQNTMIKNGINLILSDEVKKFSRNKIILNSGKEIEYDFVITAIGVRPEIKLAKEAGLNTGHGIIVNDFLQTNDRSVLQYRALFQSVDPSAFYLLNCLDSLIVH